MVTGASGFLGRSVCAQLHREELVHIGADLRAADPCDVTDRQAVDRLFRTHRIDTVIHLAATLPSACRLNPAQATKVNIVGSANLLEAAAQFGVTGFVFGSSLSVYGSDLYGAGKRAALPTLIGVK